MSLYRRKITKIVTCYATCPKCGERVRIVGKAKMSRRMTEHRTITFEKPK